MGEEVGKMHTLHLAPFQKFQHLHFALDQHHNEALHPLSNYMSFL